MKLEEHWKRKYLCVEFTLQTTFPLTYFLQAEYAQQIQDLKTAISRRDADIARIRESRDQQLAELNERRQKDSVKNKSILEVKQLSDSRAVRQICP